MRAEFGARAIVMVTARVAVAAGFLSAVADRFGLWGPHGTGHVAWGNFGSFLDYTAELAPYLSRPLVEGVGWVVTIVEIALAVALLLGVAIRWTATCGAALLTIFALSMFFFAGPETPLNASVFAAAAAAALLAVTPVDDHPWCLDRLFRGSRCPGTGPAVIGAPAERVPPSRSR